ncbi:MAG: ECF RNA polymerase sigma factor SigK [Egibacteraceae bacterium]
MDHRSRAHCSRVESLLRRLADGDQAAFVELYEQVAGQVYGLVNRILRCPSQAEEVAQEVLLEVWRTAPRYDPARGSGRTWIMTMAHRRAVDRVRREQAARERDGRNGALRDNDPFDTVAEEVELRLEHQEVRDALAQLTSLQRQAVVLAYYGGYTYPEVAELLDAPLGTVKSRMRDGLLRLRNALCTHLLPIGP